MDTTNRLQKFIGMDKPPSGASTQSEIAIAELDRSEAKSKPQPMINLPEKGKTQQQVYTETFGEKAARERAAKQEAHRKALMNRRME
jgi:hypothetical protein